MAGTRLRMDTLPIFLSKPTPIEIMDGGLMVGYGAQSRMEYAAASTENVCVGVVNNTSFAACKTNATIWLGITSFGTVNTVIESILNHISDGIYYTQIFQPTTGEFISSYPSLSDFIQAVKNYSPVIYHPIYYSHSVGCTITGQADAPSGQDVVVTVNVQSGYQFKGASGVRIVDALGDNVPFVVNGNQFSFTMPQF